MQKLSENEAELHAKFVEYGANAKLWMRKCVLLLPEIAKHRVWQKKGFTSIYEYAAKLAGMSRNIVDDALRILARISDKPTLRMVVESKGLGAVRPVITMATSDNEMFWARKAASMSVHTLETYVREFKKQEEQGIIRERGLAGTFPGAPLDASKEMAAIHARHVTDTNGQEEVQTVKAHGIGAETPTAGAGMLGVSPEMLTLSMTLDRETADMLLKLKGQGDWNTLMKELLALREEKLAAQEPEPVETTARYIPARIKKHVLLKTRGQCAYPGCSKPHKILHHTRRFALEREHDSKTLVPLCTAHERLAHQGLIEHEQEEPESWRVRQEADRDKAEYAVDRKVMAYRPKLTFQKNLPVPTTVASIKARVQST